MVNNKHKEHYMKHLNIIKCIIGATLVLAPLCALAGSVSLTDPLSTDTSASVLNSGGTTDTISNPVAIIGNDPKLCKSATWKCVAGGAGQPQNCIAVFTYTTGATSTDTAPANNCSTDCPVYAKNNCSGPVTEAK
jgi:hypothetical protein